MEKDNLFPKIMSEQFPSDMGPWITEKSEHGIKALIEIAKLLPEINNSKDISDDTKHWLYVSLAEAMDKLNVLYAFSCGINTGSGNANLLLEKHEKGLEEVKVKYGLLEKTTEQIDIENQIYFYEKLNEYLQMEQYPGRTLLQELFENNIKYLNERTDNAMFLKRIDSKLFKMANGEIEWEEFIGLATEDYKNLVLPQK
jgi:hypothetical protein